jgi:hypothetical protein
MSKGVHLFSEISNFLSKSYLNLVIIGFSLLAALNVITFFLGSKMLPWTANHTWLNQIFSNFTFDSVGTLAGLLGSIILFVPVLIGVPPKQRRWLSAYFLVASVLIGVCSSLFWNYFFSATSAAYGASAIDIAAQSIIFTTACFALNRSLFRKPHGAQLDPYVRNAFRVIYATLVMTTLWFISILQPIFVYTAQYNWRVHEIAFLSGVLVTSLYLAILSVRVREGDEITKKAELISHRTLNS